MRILYHHRIRSKDGQYVHLEEITRALRLLGHEVIVIGPASIQNEDFGADAGVIVLLKRCLPRPLYELLELGYSIHAFLRLRAAIHHHRPDCIYERNNLFQLAGAWAKRRYHLPLLLEINAPLLEERQKYGGLSLVKLASWSQNYAYSAADYLLPVTEVLAGYLRAARMPESKIIVIPNGVNFDEFHTPKKREDAKRQLRLEGRIVLGFTGFVREWHGLERVIEFIAGKPKAHRPHLLIVGDGPARHSLEERIRRLALADSVTITGVIPRDEISRYVSSFDVALQPAVVPYASPLKLFEYMVLGCGIVAPDLPNIREVLTDGYDATLFDASNPDSFHIAVTRMCADKQLRERLGAQAAKTILERGMTWETNAKKITGLYDKLGVGSRSLERV